MKKPETIKTMKNATLQGLEKSIGARIRKRRIELGLTQVQLAGKLGLSYQQIQKYETGLNRISAGRLHMISKLLFIDLEYFFRRVDNLPRVKEETIFKIPTIHLMEKRMDENVQRAIANLVSTLVKSIH